MKNVSILLFIVLIVLVLVLCSVTFQVRETESALVTRFGEVSRTIVDDPGFYWKLPRPIDSVRKFDSRSKLLVGAMEETTTRGADNILVTSYIVWKIAEPQTYLESVKNEAGAMKHLKGLLRNVQNTEVGQHYFSEFVNSDAEKIQLETIENNMYQSLKSKALADFGIDIEVVGIRQLGISKGVTTNVFERMQAERSRRKETIIAQGESEATKIKSEADAKAMQLLAIVEGYAKSIRGGGDADAAKYYKMLEEEPEFALYLQDVETLKSILKEKTTIVLGSETDLINLLKGKPNIKPQK
jgi:membrane protease subunit HflC